MQQELKELQDVLEMIDDNIDTLFLVSGNMAVENSVAGSSRDLCASTVCNMAVLLDSNLKDAKALLKTVCDALDVGC